MKNFETDVAIKKEWTEGKTDTRIARLANPTLRASYALHLIPAFAIVDVMRDEQGNLNPTKVVRLACDAADIFLNECNERGWLIHLDEEGNER